MAHDMAGAKAASIADLYKMHRLVTDSFNTRFEQDLEEGIPTDAATLGAAIKFLQNNNVSADPAEAEDLTELRENLTRISAARKNKRGNVLTLAIADYKEMEG